MKLMLNRSMDISVLLGPEYAHVAAEYEKGTDTMDVWFDSGVSWASVIGTSGMRLPVDVYLEGSK